MNSLNLQGIWYGELLFLFVNQKYLLSPITGQRLRIPTAQLPVRCIEKHITEMRKRGVAIEALPFWWTYIEARAQMPGDLSYKEFIKYHMAEWINRGYSSTLLTFPAEK